MILPRIAGEGDHRRWWRGRAAALTDRRRFLLNSTLGGAGLLGLAGCATALAPTARLAPPLGRTLAPLRAQADRLFDVTVCTRPFRAAGPRIETEAVGDALVVHNYGHGGSGWSLSWGSSAMAVQLAMASSPKRIAVIGCGALGLTSAITAQAAGAEVTIYARDLLPQTRSARATGSWTPDSRIALADAADPGFAARWEAMARTSFKTYRRYLGLPGRPVEWIDRYYLSDRTPEEAEAARPPQRLAFAQYEDRIADLTPNAELMPPGSTPFPTRRVRRVEAMMFNIADYGHTLMGDFLAAGGRVRRREFHAPAELAQLDEKVVIACPGYGARALWRDESVRPVRGQIAWLIPQPELDYGLAYDNVLMLPRRDGIVVQAIEGGDMKGYDVEDETPDPAEAHRAVATLAALYARMAPQAALGARV